MQLKALKSQPKLSLQFHIKPITAASPVAQATKQANDNNLTWLRSLLGSPRY
jgi:hypothetical protein